MMLFSYCSGVISHMLFTTPVIGSKPEREMMYFRLTAIEMNGNTNG